MARTISGTRIPKSRLGRAIKAGIPIALIIAGAQLLEGRLTIQRENGELTLTATPIVRPVHVMAADLTGKAKSCLPGQKAADQRCWMANIACPISIAIESTQQMIDMLLNLSSSSRAHRSSAHFSLRG